MRGLCLQGRRQVESEERSGPLKPLKSPVLPLTVTSSFIVFIALITAETIPFLYFICWGISPTGLGAPQGRAVRS